MIWYKKKAKIEGPEVISGIEAQLKKFKEEFGDLPVLITGHPGECGYRLSEDDFCVKFHEGKNTLFIMI